MGTALLKRSDISRYGPLMTGLRDQYGYGIDIYPKILSSGHDMLEDYARSRRVYLKKKKTKLPYDRNKNKGDLNSKDTNSGIDPRGKWENTCDGEVSRMR